MKKDLTQGSVTKTMLLFAGPMIMGNLLQQFYNIADSFIVGRFLGPGALAAVGSAYTLMVFITSVIIGLCMGSGAVFSYNYGMGDRGKVKDSVQAAFVTAGGITLVLNIMILLFERQILVLMHIPEEIMELMLSYVRIVFFGLIFVFLYNYYAYLLRALGDSFTPLCFLGATALLNVALDLLFVLVFRWGIKGAAAATLISPAISGLGIGLYTFIKEPTLRLSIAGLRIKKESAGEILRFSLSTSVQQSVMNFGILMVQGLVNSFGTAVMAAFTAGVKIDTLAYMPAQEFSNAFSLFISQNHGGGREDRVRKGVKSALGVSIGFCLVISAIVFCFAEPLMAVFIDRAETEIISIGVGYLRIEGAFYIGIGILFLLYAYFRGTGRPEISILLTVISLGSRVLLAYILAPVEAIGVVGIWWAIPIGWFLADTTGLLLVKRGPNRAAKYGIRE
ncbi:MAG: MATE family efflux transporter [Oscillospiraceae bacterium]|nr:MATE family efflux transporter [Oscillospiraceae bacterium]